MPGPNLTKEARHQWTGLLLSKLQNLALDSLDLIFPPRCVGCGRVDAVWCSHCQKELEAVPIRPYYRTAFKILEIASTGIHEGKLQQAVQSLKYDSVQSLASPLAKRMVSILITTNRIFDTIIPIPLHITRQRERGYNQARILAEHVSNQLCIPCETQAVQRIRYTRSQVGLTRNERLQNVADAFLTESLLVKDKSILLVDDVCTTGATLAACARSLLRSGAVAVYGITVTSAQPDAAV